MAKSDFGSLDHSSGFFPQSPQPLRNIDRMSQEKMINFKGVIHLGSGILISLNVRISSYTNSHVRASVNTSTTAGFSACRTLKASFIVVPVVKISSTSNICRSRIDAGERTSKAPAMLSTRSCAGISYYFAALCP